jgi:hypothetical protein
MARDDPEHRLSHWVNELLERILLEPCWYTAQDHSGRAINGSQQMQMNWRQKQRWYGVKPSQLDWRVIQCQAILYAEVELKCGSGRPDAGQETTMRLLRERGIPTGCAWSVGEFADLLKSAGFRLHPDTDAIVADIAARHAAADAAASAKAPTRKRSGKAMQAKPSLRRIRKAEALRSGGLRF